MAREFSRKFYNSKTWKQCRDAYKISVGGLCERCYNRGDYVLGDEVHHKIHLNPSNINDPNITLSWDNLELLCQSCHQSHHHRMPVEDDGYSFDSNGQVIYTPPLKGN